MAYKVKLDIFEGPFDLLVYLIEHARMSIYDIHVSEITTQYLSYIHALQKQDISVAQEFMVLAAELIELKSKLLLPGSAQEIAAEGDEDPRSGLVAQLIEYKRYKELAEFLAEQEEANSHIHTKPQEDLAPYTGQPDEFLRADMNQFVKAFRAFLFKKQKLEEMKKSYQQVERQRMSIESRIEQIRNFFLKKSKVKFSELVSADGQRYNLVLTFVSLLELLRQSTITARQKELFGDIELTLKKTAEEGNSQEMQRSTYDND